MGVGELVTLFIVTMIIFLVIDIAWIGFIAKEHYDKALKKFIRKDPPPVRAAIFYCIFILGLLVMVLVPAINEESLGIAMFRGAAFGFFTYATYGLTNWTLIKNWPTRITLEDIAWGTFLSFAVSTIAYNIHIALF